ncbi:MAG: inositol monophosphatase family protein [Bacteroidales bacterium]
MDLERVAKEVCRVAEEAGFFIRTEAAGFSSDAVMSKAYHDLVSYVDTEAEKIIVEGLSDIIPGASFHTEEETSARETGEYIWYIDPLDGTTNFVHGVAPYSVSIALNHNGSTIVGVVLDVTAHEMFRATLGGGAWLNGERINVSVTPSVDQGLFATGFPVRKFHRLTEYMRCLEYFIRNSRGVRRMGSASVDLAHVACGRYDGFFEYGLNPWDILAGALIVREAGGRATDFSGNDEPLTGEEIVAGNLNISDEVTNIVKGFMIIK